MTKTQLLQLDSLAEQMREKRRMEDLTLRDLEDQIGVSASTLSRIERGRGNLPDTRTLTAIARWLGRSVEQYVDAFSEHEVEVPDKVEVFLRADRRLDERSADNLARLFRLAYDAAVDARAKAEGEGPK